jgi:hypothetical protein
VALGIERLPAFTPPVDQTETAEETVPAQTAWIVRPGAATVGELRNLYIAAIVQTKIEMKRL